MLFQDSIPSIYVKVAHQAHTQKQKVHQVSMFLDSLHINILMLLQQAPLCTDDWQENTLLLELFQKFYFCWTEV